MEIPDIGSKNDDAIISCEVQNESKEQSSYHQVVLHAKIVYSRSLDHE